jgi:hypothetical protein
MIEAVAAALAGEVQQLRGHAYHRADPFWRTAADHHVDLLALDRAKTSGADRAWPQAARRAAHEALVDACVLRDLRDRELQCVLHTLAAADIPCLLMKGAALAHTLYRHPHLRPRNDADLLVRAEDSGRLAAALHPRRYARLASTSGAYVTSQTQFDRLDGGDHRYALDIHWRVVNTHVVDGAVAYEDFAAARMAVPGLGRHAWTLGVPDALALACIHRVAHHQNSGDLLWLWDVRLLVDAMTPDETGAFVGIASRLKIRAACATTLTAAAGRFQMPAASRLIDRVRPDPGDAPEPSARFLRGAMSQTDLLRSDLASLGWRGGAALVREHLFPPAAYMREHYAGWPAVLLPAAYVHRILAGAPKWLRRS